MITIGLINPQNNKLEKTVTSDILYRDSDTLINEMNEKLNRKGNKKGKYWKVLSIG